MAVIAGWVEITSNIDFITTDFIDNVFIDLTLILDIVKQTTVDDWATPNTASGRATAIINILPIFNAIEQDIDICEEQAQQYYSNYIKDDWSNPYYVQSARWTSDGKNKRAKIERWVKWLNYSKYLIESPNLNRYQDLEIFTHGELNRYTHKQLRKEVL